MSTMRVIVVPQGQRQAQKYFGSATPTHPPLIRLMLKGTLKPTPFPPKRFAYCLTACVICRLEAVCCQHFVKRDE